jgi:hypothetical protein
VGGTVRREGGMEGGREGGREGGHRGSDPCHLPFEFFFHAACVLYRLVFYLTF